ncbi:malate:quinone oxidoreductase [Sanguibacter suaedae]|uniref:Probable malate:quinone oxidoreductase n=1 Tax=Sanguibacter suaedae TaxID=2795737 RepID=A0A934ICJ5_9MICO|nr:malate:quinone oxidoreductase [Sanguibacter suaedae]MBI9114399.1 malate:quinone oxidoreductase [Sanguibacter suaedae]
MAVGRPSIDVVADRREDLSTPIDVVLVGGGIMSATLGTILRLLEPSWTIRVYERLDAVAQESSNAWNNAGTGHAALCELNYTPQRPDGTVDITKAVAINEQFQVSRELWQHLVSADLLPDPSGFISSTPHMTFVRGAENVEFLRRRHAAMAAHPLFADLEFSDDPDVIARWAPLLLDERADGLPVAATRASDGTDVDFGALTRHLTDFLTANGVDLLLEHEVTSISRRRDGGWRLKVADRSWNARERHSTVDARFVFVGAGGGALPLLQKSGIPEIKGYGGFPISGVFLRTTNPEIVARHHAKVYGKADVGSPPMSVPHLDTRVVDGGTSLMFGPYAGFSTKFLKKGSLLDLFRSVRPSNILTMLTVAKDNWDLTAYLIREVTKSRWSKFRALRDFMPTADPKDWEFITAGQRVQVMKTKPGSRGGVLEFGTELVTSADGSIAGLLGASPGASTAVPAMVDLLERCFPDRFPAWHRELATMMPSLDNGQWDSDEELAHLADDAEVQRAV